MNIPRVEDLGPDPSFPTQVQDPRASMSPFDYTRENIALLREDVKQQFNHERAYRKQYGDMAANAMVALSEQGWVTLKLSQLQQGQETMQKGQNRIFVTAFGLLVSTLSLSIAVIFNVATR